MTYEDAVDAWKSNDEWQFADKEACWRFMFEKGQESLRQQLAAALASCKLKDEALEKACTRIEEYGFEIGEHWNTGRKALAIQPDDSALKAWLGEPRSYLYKFNSEFGDGTFWSHRPTHNGSNALETIPLYAPKEMK